MSPTATTHSPAWPSTAAFSTSCASRTSPGSNSDCCVSMTIAITSVSVSLVMVSTKESHPREPSVQNREVLEKGRRKVYFAREVRFWEMACLKKTKTALATCAACLIELHPQPWQFVRVLRDGRKVIRPIPRSDRCEMGTLGHPRKVYACALGYVPGGRDAAVAFPALRLSPWPSHFLSQFSAIVHRRRIEYIVVNYV